LAAAAVVKAKARLVRVRARVNCVGVEKYESYRFQHFWGAMGHASDWRQAFDGRNCAASATQTPT
jgi:hypothetical protein